MQLEENGKTSSGKCTHHFHIKFFYITDLINRNKIQMEYCQTDDMIAYYMTKPLVGVKFECFCKLIPYEPPNLDSDHFLDWPA